MAEIIIVLAAMTPICHEVGNNQYSFLVIGRRGILCVRIDVELERRTKGGFSGGEKCLYLSDAPK